MFNNKIFYTLLFLLSAGFTAVAMGQRQAEGIEGLKTIVLDSGVIMTIDAPVLDRLKPTELILYALPNGNTTAQTFGKKQAAGDDWHFDIQHIGAQTAFIRQANPGKNYIVVYLENNLKSWPAWRRKFKDANARILEITTMLVKKYRKYHPKLTLAAHSGGGSFIFGFLEASRKLPSYLSRLAWLDATYGYETGKHKDKLAGWLQDPEHRLEVIAYNDSVVVYNGKPLVSPTGGTWYRSKLMAADLEIQGSEQSDRITCSSPNAAFLLIKNPEGKIYHTVLVEKNGFIHAVLDGTPFENKGYQVWGERAYSGLILQ